MTHFKTLYTSMLLASICYSLPSFTMDNRDELQGRTRVGPITWIPTAYPIEAPSFSDMSPEEEELWYVNPSLASDRYGPDRNPMYTDPSFWDRPYSSDMSPEEEDLWRFSPLEASDIYGPERDPHFWDCDTDSYYYYWQGWNEEGDADNS